MKAKLIESKIKKYETIPTHILLNLVNKYKWSYDSDTPIVYIDRELNCRVSDEIKEYDHSGNLIDKVMAGYDDDGQEVWL